MDEKELKKLAGEWAVTKTNWGKNRVDGFVAGYQACQSELSLLKQELDELKEEHELLVNRYAHLNGDL